jgi:hypothetical protein
MSTAFVQALLPDPSVERFDALDITDSATNRYALKLLLDWFSMR